MFNNTKNTQNTSIKINAVTGNILKNYKDSFFVHFHLKSKTADGLFDRQMLSLKEVKGYYDDYRYGTEKPAVILQMMLCGDSEVIAEVMWKEDFDKMFEEVEE